MENQNASLKDKMPKYKNCKIILESERIPYLKNFLGNHLFRLGDCEMVVQKFYGEAKKCSPPLTATELQEIYKSARHWYDTEIRTHPDYKDPCKNQYSKWQKPREITEITPLPFPVDDLPNSLQWFIKGVSEFTETAMEMCGVLTVGALAGTYQRKYEVISTAGNCETESMYTVAVAGSAERKSAVIQKVIAPILAFQKEYNFKHKADISEDNAKRKSLERDLSKAEKDGTEQEIIDAQKALDAFTPRIKLSLLSQDVTPEAIVKDMKEQGERSIIASAEGGFFEKINGRYSPNSADHEVYLLAQAGDFISVKRVGRPNDELERPAISMILCAQQCVIDEFIANPKFRGVGLSARFLYAVCKEKAGHERSPVRRNFMEYYTAVFENYSKVIVKSLETTVDMKETKYVKLSKEAHDFACGYFHICESNIRQDVETMKSWNGKSYGAFIRIAGLFHCFECFEKDVKPEDSGISLLNVQRAAKVVDCFHSHALKLFSAADKVNADAIYLLKRIETKLTKCCDSDTQKFSKSEILRLTHGHFKTAEELTSALELLVDYGYISTNFLQTGGRPSEQIEVNPFFG